MGCLAQPCSSLVFLTSSTKWKNGNWKGYQVQGEIGANLANLANLGFEFGTWRTQSPRSSHVARLIPLQKFCHFSLENFGLGNRIPEASTSTA